MEKPVNAGRVREIVRLLYPVPGHDGLVNIFTDQFDPEVYEHIAPPPPKPTTVGLKAVTDLKLLDAKVLVEGVETLDALEVLEAAERKGKSRQGVRRAIAAKRAELMNEGD